MKKRLKIGAYIRVSTDKQVQVFEGSLDTQKFRMAEFVKTRNRESKNWGDIVDYYVDEGHSAGSDRRPAYQRLMRDVRAGKVNLILVADISRLSRNTVDFGLLLKELERLNASYLSMKEQFDTTTPAGRMMTNMVVTMAQFEREQTSERVSINFNSRAVRGYVNGGKAPLGFERHPEKAGLLVVNEREARAVRTIFAEFLKQGGIGKTIPVLEALQLSPKCHGIAKENGTRKEWTYSLVRDVLMNPAYIGKREVNKKNKGLDPENLKPWQQYQVVKASWPAIVDEEVFEDVQRILEENLKNERRRLVGAEYRIFMLSGVLTCGECGRHLNGQSSHAHGEVHRYYAHAHKQGERRNCSLKRIRADDIEKVVANHFVEVIARAGYFEDLEEKLKKLMSSSENDLPSQLLHSRNLLKDKEMEIAGVFKLHSKVGAGTDSSDLVAEQLDRLAKEKKAIQQHVDWLENLEATSEETRAVRNDIEERVLMFRKGFRKGTPVMQRRLLRRMLERLVYRADGIEVHFPVHEARMKVATVASGLTGREDNILEFKRANRSSAKNKRAESPLSLSSEFLPDSGIGWGRRTRTSE